MKLININDLQPVQKLSNLFNKDILKFDRSNDNKDLSL